jgi:hypothetical protein
MLDWALKPPSPFGPDADAPICGGNLEMIDLSI